MFSIIQSDQPFCTLRSKRLHGLWRLRGKRRRSPDCRLSRLCRLRYRDQLQTIGHSRTVLSNLSESSARDHPTATACPICGVSHINPLCARRYYPRF